MPPFTATEFPPPKSVSAARSMDPVGVNAPLASILTISIRFPLVLRMYI